MKDFQSRVAAAYDAETFRREGHRRVDMLAVRCPIRRKLG